MKKIIIPLLLLIRFSIFGQSSVEDQKQTVFGKLDKTRIENNILINSSVLPIDISKFDGKDTGLRTALSYYQAATKLKYSQLDESIQIVNSEKLKELCKIEINKNKTVPIGIVAVSYSSIKEDAFNEGLLTYSNGVLLDNSSTSSPYNKKMCIVSTPLIENAIPDNGEVRYLISLDFTITTIKLNKIEIDFDDGNGYQQVFLNDEISIYYSKFGEKTIKTKFTDGTNTYVSFSSYFIGNNTVSLKSGGDDYGNNRTSDLKTNIEATYNGSTIKGKYGIYYGCNNSNIKKPVVIIEGFDPYDSKTIDPSDGKDKHNLYAITDTKEGLLDALSNSGFDIIILDFEKNNIDLRASAQLSAKLIQEVNQLKQADHELIVMGRSGGGLIARYALAYLEQQNINHETRLLLTIDSPNEGANIPLGLQHFLETAVNQVQIATLISTFGIVSINDLLSSTLNSKYSKQMLYYHHSATNTGSKQAKPSQDYTTFFSSLNSQNGGYPTRLKKVAISNGSRTAQNQGFSSSQQLLEWNYPSDLFMATLRISNKVRALPDVGQSCKIMETNVETRFPILPPLFSPWIKVFGTTVEVNNTPPYDNAPGGNTGWHNLTIENIIPNGSWAATLIFPGVSLTGGNDCFVPIRSALALNSSILPSAHGGLFYNISSQLALNPDIFVHNNFYYNFSENISPFDVLYIDNSNKQHGTSNSDWTTLFENEIYPTSAYIQNEETSTNKTVYATQDIEVGNNVTSNIPAGDVTVKNGAKLKLTAGESITLKPGFVAELGSELELKIHEEQDCNSLLKSATVDDNLSKTQSSNSLKSGDTENEIFQIIIETEKSFIVYPNPTLDKLYISCNKYFDSQYTIEVIDNNGNLLSSQISHERNSIINISDFPTGIYHVRIELNGELTVEKIIKQ